MMTNDFETKTGGRKASVRVMYAIENDLVDKIWVYYHGVEVSDILSEADMAEIRIECEMHLGSQ